MDSSTKGGGEVPGAGCRRDGVLEYQGRVGVPGEGCSIRGGAGVPRRGSEYQGWREEGDHFCKGTT